VPTRLGKITDQDEHRAPPVPPIRPSHRDDDDDDNDNDDNNNNNHRRRR
jgi:hypothetical protein